MTEGKKAWSVKVTADKGTQTSAVEPAGLHPRILAIKKQSAEELSDGGHGGGEKGPAEAEAVQVKGCSCGCDRGWKCPFYFRYPPYYSSEELKQETVEVVSSSPPPPSSPPLPPPPSPAVAAAAAAAAATEEEKQKRREDLSVHLLRQLSVHPVLKEEEEEE